MDFIQVGRQVTPVIHRVQQGVRDGAVTLTQGGEVQLPFQMIVEGFGGRAAAFKV